MLINKEKSKKIVKLVSLTLSTSMLMSLGAYSFAQENGYPTNQIKHHKIVQNYLGEVERLSPDLYDNAYNDICNNGIISLNEYTYFINDLYLMCGKIENEDIVYLTDYHNPSFDILSSNNIDKEFQRKKIMLLKYSDVFYEYYNKFGLNKIDFTIFVDYMEKFQGNINYATPETFFYDSSNQTKRGK